MKAYTMEAQSAEEFVSAREQFEELVDQLCSEPVMKHFEHGEVEALVEREGWGRCCVGCFKVTWTSEQHGSRSANR